MSPKALEKYSNGNDELDTHGIRSAGFVPDGGHGRSG
jgi:hypothetical protein